MHTNTRDIAVGSLVEYKMSLGNEWEVLLGLVLSKNSSGITVLYTRRGKQTTYFAAFGTFNSGASRWKPLGYYSNPEAEGK